MFILVLLLPFVSALILIFLGNVFSFRIKLKNVFSYLVSCTPAAISAFIVLWGWITHLEGQTFKLSAHLWFNWFNSTVTWEENVNSLTINMLLLVNLVGFVVLAFSPIYMYEEKNLTTFHAYVYLFIGFMNLLLFAETPLQFFVGWEGIGICSYLLIGFWSGRFSAARAAYYAMLINKVGDITFLVAACYLAFHQSWLEYDLFSYEVIHEIHGYEFSINKVVCSLLLFSVFCKSAQIVFHGWLPEAMEGPTPVSALIHAATMVTAGNYLVIKLSPYWISSVWDSHVLIFFGAFTCIMASMIAFYQVDIKKVVAYSTCSQLGYMVLACGASMYEESLNHCLSHGFFKALLFLASGWVIHVYRHSQSSTKMGGKGILSMEFIYFLIGSGSLVALPLSSGWYSKEAIIIGCVNKNICIMLVFAVWVAAILTSLYSTQIFYRVFIKGAKEAGLEGESTEIERMSTGNQINKQFIYTVCSSLFLLGNFSFFFGYISAARNLEIINEFAPSNLTFIEVINISIYILIIMFFVRFILRVVAKIVKPMSLKSPRFVITFFNTICYHSKAQFTLLEVYMFIYTLSLVYILNIMYFFPVVISVFSYRVLSKHTIKTLSEALHFGSIQQIFWGRLGSESSWFNERFEPLSFKMIHIKLSLLLASTKKSAKFLRNNIPGWALITSLIVWIVVLLISI